MAILFGSLNHMETIQLMAPFGKKLEETFVRKIGFL
jgi:hypothetical protein